MKLIPQGLWTLMEETHAVIKEEYALLKYIMFESNPFCMVFDARGERRRKGLLFYSWWASVNHIRLYSDNIGDT
jgi:hypothetical protein